MQNGAVPKLHSRSLALCGVHSPTPSAIHSSPSSSSLEIPNSPESSTPCLSWVPECIICALESPRPSQRPGICHYPAVVPEVFRNLLCCLLCWGSLSPLRLANFTAYRACHAQAWPGATKHWKPRGVPANETIKSRAGALSGT